MNYCKWMRVSVKTSGLQTASSGLYPYLLWGARKEKQIGVLERSQKSGPGNSEMGVVGVAG